MGKIDNKVMLWAGIGVAAIVLLYVLGVFGGSKSATVANDGTGDIAPNTGGGSFLNPDFLNFYKKRNAEGWKFI